MVAQREVHDGSPYESADYESGRDARQHDPLVTRRVKDRRLGERFAMHPEWLRAGGHDPLATCAGVAEPTTIQRQDGIPIRHGLGYPRAVPLRAEVVPVDVGVTPAPTASSARDDVPTEGRERIFQRLRMEVARHGPRVARRLGECSRRHPEGAERKRRFEFPPCAPGGRRPASHTRATTLTPCG